MMMVMMADMVDHKRRSCSDDSFVLRNLAGEKRLKTDIPAKVCVLHLFLEI